MRLIEAHFSNFLEVGFSETTDGVKSHSALSGSFGRALPAICLKARGHFKIWLELILPFDGTRLALSSAA
ncbi:MAG TPA: hypothetical protein VGF59_33290 [Bryobacteraceae bacterium]|jgi:hypothetical protein